MAVALSGIHFCAIATVAVPENSLMSPWPSSGCNCACVRSSPVGKKEQLLKGPLRCHFQEVPAGWGFICLIGTTEHPLCVNYNILQMAVHIRH